MGKTTATDHVADDAPPEYAAPQATDNPSAPQRTEEEALPPPPVYVRSVGAARWLEINLRICNVTAWIMFAVAIANLGFAGVVKEDLQDDTNAHTCAYCYILDADEPWVGRQGPGRYESQCRTLLHWSYVATTAASISMIRALVSFFHAGTPTFWAVRFSGGSMLDRKFPPSRVYLVRAAFSLVALALYLAAVIMLASSRLITGPVARSGDATYRQMMTVALALLVVSALASAHQAFCAGVVAFAFRGTVRQF